MKNCLKNGLKPFKKSQLQQIGYEFHKVNDELVKTGFTFVINANEDWETAYVRQAESPIPLNSMCFVPEWAV